MFRDVLSFYLGTYTAANYSGTRFYLFTMKSVFTIKHCNICLQVSSQIITFEVLRYLTKFQDSISLYNVVYESQYPELLFKGIGLLSLKQ